MSENDLRLYKTQRHCLYSSFAIQPRLSTHIYVYIPSIIGIIIIGSLVSSSPGCQILPFSIKGIGRRIIPIPIITILTQMTIGPNVVGMFLMIGEMIVSKRGGRSAQARKRRRRCCCCCCKRARPRGHQQEQHGKEFHHDVQ